MDVLWCLTRRTVTFGWLGLVFRCSSVLQCVNPVAFVYSLSITDLRSKYCNIRHDASMHSFGSSQGTRVSISEVSG